MLWSNHKFLIRKLGQVSHKIKGHEGKFGALKLTRSEEGLNDKGLFYAAGPRKGPTIRIYCMQRVRERDIYF